MKEKKQKQCGFTLMEVLVSMSIFAIFTLAILSIHSVVLNASQNTLAENRVQQESQFIMDVLAKKIRTSRVDYYYYDENGNIADNPQTELALTDLAGVDYIFSLVDGSLMISVDGDEPQPIPAENTQIESINFYIYPTTFPFSLDSPPETQPRVTVVMTASAEKGKGSSNITLQQTMPQLSGGVIE